MNSSSPHRQAALIRLCDQCKQTATSACRRCNRSLCDVHHPDSDEFRCQRCEADWKSYGHGVDPVESRTGPRVSTTVGAIAVGGGAMGFLTTIWGAPTVLALAVAGTVAGLCSAFFAIGYGVPAIRARMLTNAQKRALRGARADFLADRPERLLAGKVESGEND